ncbi:uncharacterized protein LOC131669367 [Phymastichus coffea]|uniref:uncharacterized protein LOC131669367 n=1 Tax=Phymastichus coffea TaxID=108790 RepID=UPI00273B0D88|nr:uncharacterized protein LOC131669367 [Phymastichus coffea]
MEGQQPTTAASSWRDNSEESKEPQPDIREVRILQKVGITIPPTNLRKKMLVLNDLLSHFDKDGNKNALHSIKKPHRSVKVKTLNRAIHLIKEDQQFLDLVNKIQSPKFKITADPKVDYSINGGVATMSCYDKVPRDCSENSDSHSNGSVKNVSITCTSVNHMPVNPVETTDHIVKVNFPEGFMLEDCANLEAQNVIDFSRRFREYCTNMINPQLNKSLEKFVAELSRLQKNLYNRNNVKGRCRRRYYAGFKETEKRFKINKIKLVIIAPDLDQKNDNGELDDLVHRFIVSCKRHELATVFGLSRRKLGYLTRGQGFTSCIGIANYEATEDKLEDALRKALEAKNQFKVLSGQANKTIDEKTILTEDLLLSERVKILLRTLALP